MALFVCGTVSDAHGNENNSRIIKMAKFGIFANRCTCIFLLTSAIDAVIDALFKIDSNSWTNDNAKHVVLNKRRDGCSEGVRHAEKANTCLIQIEMKKKESYRNKAFFRKMKWMPRCVSKMFLFVRWNLKQTRFFGCDGKNSFL